MDEKKIIKDLEKEINNLKKIKEGLKRIVRDHGRSNIIYKREIETLIEENEKE